jgi:glucose dehydrogenase
MVERLNDSTRRQWLRTVVGSLTGLVLPACGRQPASDLAEVCIVGSGPAGAVLACDLARRGVRTVLLEGGPVYASRPNRPVESQDNSISRAEPIRYPVDRTRFLGDGGTSNLWGGECPRFQPADFDRRNPYVPTDASWPISYDDIEPYYQKAEREWSIGGGAPSRYSPPRRTDFPFQPSADETLSCLQGLVGPRGWVVEPTPKSRSPRVAQTHLPRLATYPSARFLRNTRVTRIITEPGGRIAGLLARGPDSVDATIRARFYVLACGGIETPRLLLWSRTAEFPQGIGNSFDLVGRHFMEHLAIDVGTFRLKTKWPCSEHAYETGISWQFSSELKQQGLGNAVLEIGFWPSESTFRISAILEMKSSASNRVMLSTTEVDAFGSPLAEVFVAISDHERKTFAHVQRLGRRIADSINAHVVELGSDRFGWCHHHMGTCRMGLDERTSVVDKDLKVHNTDNLYLAGSAAFVTVGAGSPTLLLTALALRLADHLAARVRASG